VTEIDKFHNDNRNSVNATNTSVPAPDPWSRLLSSRVKSICASLLCEYHECFVTDFSEFKFVKSNGPNSLWATEDTFTILLGAESFNFSTDHQFTVLHWTWNKFTVKNSE